jgi:hypothetical protein
MSLVRWELELELRRKLRRCAEVRVVCARSMG